MLIENLQLSVDNEKISNNCYRVSECGVCERVLAAQRLSYEPIPLSSQQLSIFRDGNLIEDDILSSLQNKGINIRDRQREVMYNIASDIIPPLVGHIDALTDNRLIEIKSFNRFQFEKIKNGGWNEIPKYLAQVNTYLLCLKDEIEEAILIGKCKDTSALIELSWQFSQDLANQIIDKLVKVEIYVQDNKLPEIAYDEKSCRWCRFRYLCTDENRTAKVETLPSLLEAAEIYKEGKRFEAMAKDRIEQARTTFVAHSKTSGIDKYTCGGISVSYLGQRTRTWLDEVIIRAEASLELIEKATKQSVPWDDIRLRLVKED